MTHLIDLDKLIEHFHKEADRCAQNARSPPENTVSSSVWEDRSVLYATLAEDLEYMADHLSPDEKAIQRLHSNPLKDKKRRTDLHEGDEVVIRIRGTFEEIQNHGTPGNPRWIADVRTRSGLHSVSQEDVTPYIEIPQSLRHCSVCGCERVWDDPRREMPVLICPRCAYEELKRLEEIKTSLQKSLTLALKLGGVLASAEKENTDDWMAYRDGVIADANREIAVLSLSSPVELKESEE